MVKLPRPGRVKTRLGRDIGMVPAAWWLRHQTAGLLRRLDDPRWQLVLAVSPDSAVHDLQAWPAHLPRVGQGGGDLGARMGRLLYAMPPGPVLIVGGDIPALGPKHIARAFALLGRADAVFGPATDGGFWGVGLRRTAAVPAGLFKDVRWSTEHALADTLATIPGLRLALADRLSDVDTAADLRPRCRDGFA